MTARLPDWLFNLLERLVEHQREIRRYEGETRAQAQDLTMCAHCDERRARHSAGTCGGAAYGCSYGSHVRRVTS